GKTLHSILPNPVNNGANEKLLFHGTRRQNLDAILAQGFDPNVAYSGLFGSGSYFAEDLAKAAQYARRPGDYIIICRVILGHVYVQKQHNNDMRRPPCLVAPSCTASPCTHKLHDSVCGAVATNPREFILYRHDHAYPWIVVEL